MSTLDALLSAALLILFAFIAFHPRAAAKLNATRPGRWANQATSVLGTRWYWLLFALTLLIALLARLWRFPELPRGLNQDEAMSAAEAFTLLRNGTDQYGTSWPAHFEAWQYGQMSVLLSYWTLPFFALFGVSRLTIRLPMLVVSLIALPVFWDFARRMAGRKYALVALLVVAICPWHIMQSRWSIDADMLPHMLLFSLYFLTLGLGKRSFLYLSMVFFGLTMYAYGITLYTVPPLLVILCAYLLYKKRIRLWEALLCAAIYLLVAAPFLITMLINFFEWDTITLGPLTMPRFYETVRMESIIFFGENPFGQLSANLEGFLSAAVLQNMGVGIFAYKPTRVFYAFSTPVLLLGLALLWWKRRRAALAIPTPTTDQAGRLDTAFFVLAWLFAALLSSLITNDPNTNRVNAVFYPLLLCLAAGLYGVARRAPLLAAPMALIYLLGFLTFWQGYFHNQPYIDRMAQELHNDMYGALVEARTMDVDRYYIDSTLVGGAKSAEMMAVLAHGIDAQQLQGEKPMLDAEGNELDIYPFRYVYTDFSDFTPDETECAAYVIQRDKQDLFDLSEYIVTEHDLYLLLYPRYWAEE